MSQAANLVAIKAVQLAALNLTLACTEIVGARAMALAMPTAPMLGDPLPDKLQHDADRIEEERKK